MPLRDDPVLVLGPLGFAVRINAADPLNVADARLRVPGLLKFARTFIAEVLEKEFDTPITGFPVAARAKAAELAVHLKYDIAPSLPAQRLVMSIIDLCDLEIDLNVMSGESDEDDEDYLDLILVRIHHLLCRFADWVDPQRLPLLSNEAVRARDEFAAASARLST